MNVSPEALRQDVLAVQAGITNGILPLPANRVATLEDDARQALVRNVMQGVSDTMQPDVSRRLRAILVLSLLYNAGLIQKILLN